MKISIVTAYYNRKKLFYETLKSISKSKYMDFEVITVDDGSLPDERIDDFINEFPFLKVIRIEPKNKWYCNSCVPFNVGIRAATGDIIILQNPECLHVHDIITYVSENINNSNYISISAYAINKEITNKLPSLINNDFITYFKTLPQQCFSDNAGIGWYNHSKYRPVHYHFCSAITKKNMDLLGGFDERYAYGIAYEDDELIIRIGKLGLKKIISDEVSVIHQLHSPTFYLIPNATQLKTKNRMLLSMTRNEWGYYVNNLNKIKL